MSRQIIRFGDEPIAVIFDDELGIQGQAVESGYGGSEWQHFVNEGQAMIYLPAAAQMKLEQSGAKRGDAVAITKRKRGRNNDWSVEVCEPEPGRRSQPPSRARQERIEGAQSYSQPQTRGANALAPQPEPAPHPADTLVGRMSNHQARPLARCLCLAIDAALAGEEYAKACKAHFSFSADDIRALAATLYINSAKEGRP